MSVRAPYATNIGVYYLLGVVNNAVFILGNWIFFWERYMTYSQLGVVDALAFAFGIVMEIPTGGISDMIGKKKTLLISCLMNIIGFGLMASTNSLAQLFAGFLFFQIGLAFYSGAADAMAYDSLKQHGAEVQFDKVIARNNSLAWISLVVCTLIGGLLYNINFRLPHYAQGVVYIFGLAGTFLMTEPEVDSTVFTMKNYVKQLGSGFTALWQPRLRYLLPALLGLPGIYFLFSWGLVQPAIAIQFGFLADAQALIQAGLGAVSALILVLMPRLRRQLGDVWGLVVVGLVLGIGFVGAALPLGFYGIVVIALIRFAGTFIQPWATIIVNEHVQSDIRSTTLSTLALIVRLPYIVGAIIAGRMVEAGSFWLFNAAIAAIVLVLLVWTLALAFRYRRQGNVPA